MQPGSIHPAEPKRANEGAIRVLTTSTRSRRLAALAIALALLAITVALLRPAEVEGKEPPPGVQPAVQKWLKVREKAQIEVNNALIAIVQKKIEKPGVAPTACQRLDRATKVLLRLAAAPNARVDELSRAGLLKFEQGAAACLAGDIPTAERLVAEGLAERTAAAGPLDETLDGD